MGGTTTGLAAVLATGLLLAAAAPTYADSGHGPDDDDLRLSFDRLDSSGFPLLDALGGAEVVGAVSAVRGGHIWAGPDRSGWGHSLRMERFQPGEAHPAVVVVRPEAGGYDPTDPGSDDFAFGADFVLDEQHGVSATDNGDNLVQRGLVGPRAQYKIQVDGGYPLCRIHGSDGAVAVRATQPVDAEQWYRVRCRRVGDRVTLRVVSSLDSVREVREYVATGPTGSLSYGSDDPPFSIGGKVDADGAVLADDSDQFNGLVDNVVVRHLD